MIISGIVFLAVLARGFWLRSEVHRLKGEVKAGKILATSLRLRMNRPRFYP